MAKFCLIPQQVQKFKEALKNGTLNPEKLAVMTSIERRAFLEKLVGKENGVQVNSLFESKLLLKNQKAGYISWAKKVGGLSKDAKRDLFSRIERMDKILNPQEEQAFLEDLAATRLGFGVSETEAKTIFDLSKQVSDTSMKMDLSSLEKMTPVQAEEWLKNPINKTAAKDYGRKVIALDNYITELKESSKKIPFSENKLKAGTNAVKASVDTSKAMNASMDDSAIFNQGFGILANYKTVGIWRRNAVGTFKNLIRTFGGKEVWDEFRADLVSRPNYINGMYNKIGLALKVTEEQYPTSIPAKVGNIPVIKNIPIVNLPFKVFSRLYKASEVAFNIFQFKNRADVADKFLAIADKNGVTDLRGVGQLINSLTGRGNLGRLEPVGDIVNAPFFSLRRQVSLMDSLTGYQVGLDKGNFARKEGALATLQQISMIGVVLGTASVLLPGSVEWDTNSADFGKIRVGSTRIDATHGLASYVTLVSRLITSKYKSSTSGKISDINSKDFGSKTDLGLLGDFALNKISPALQQLIYIKQGKDRSGNPVTPLGVLTGLYVPLNFKNVAEMINNPDSANFILGGILDGVGILTNTYPNANVKSGMIPTGTKIENDSFIHGVQVYADALKTDPETAFNRIFTQQRILRTENGAIIVERMAVGDSQAYKKKYGANTKQVKLDHTVPLELGGSNSSDNLKLVPTSDWSSYTKVENALGKALKNNKISKQEAQSLIKKFKQITDTKQRKDYGDKIIKQYR